MLFLLDLGQPVLETLGKLGAAGLFLGTVALDVQPRRIIIHAHLPQLAVVLGDLLVRLADEKLERLADVLLLDAQLPSPPLFDLAEVFGRNLVERPVDHAVLVCGGLADRRGDFLPSVGRLEVEQGIGLTLAEPPSRQVKSEQAFAHHLTPAVFDTTLEEPQDRRLRGVGIEETCPLVQGRAVVRQHSFHNALEQRMAGTDEFQVGVADDLFLVKGDLRIAAADLTATALDTVGQLSQVGRNAADGPDALAILDGRDGAAERAICLDEELLDIFRHKPVAFALLLVG